MRRHAEIMTPAEQLELARRARAGDLAARDELVERMEGWAVRRALRYWPQAKGRHEFDDLLQEARIGLLDAVDRFDPERGIRFQTYSAYWMDNRISRLCFSQAAPVWIPVNVVSYLKGESRGRDSPLYSGMTQPQVDTARAILARKVMRVGFDAGLGGPEVGPQVATDDTRDREAAEARVEAQAILDAIPREADRRALRLRFGLDTGEPVSFPDVARIMGIGLSEASQSLVRVRKALTGRERLPRHLRPSPEYFPPKETSACPA